MHKSLHDPLIQSLTNSLTDDLIGSCSPKDSKDNRNLKPTRNSNNYKDFSSQENWSDTNVEFE